MAHPDGNMGFNPELESTLKKDTLGRIEAGLPETPDPKPFVKAEYAPGMKMGELAARVVTQADVQRGILISAAQEQFEADKAKPVEPGPEFGTRQADRDNKAFEDLKAAKERIEADAAKAVKYAKVIEDAPSVLLEAFDKAHADYEAAINERDNAFVDIVATARPNSAEAKIQTEFIDDVQEASSKYSRLVKELKDAGNSFGIENINEIPDDSVLDANVAQKTESLKQSLELAQRVHGEGDESARHYQEEIEAVIKSADMLKTHRDRDLIEEARFNLDEEVASAERKRMAELRTLANDKTRKGTRLSKANQLYYSKVDAINAQEDASVFNTQEAINYLGIEGLTPFEIFRQARHQKETEVETGGPVEPVAVPAPVEDLPLMDSSDLVPSAGETVELPGDLPLLSEAPESLVVPIVEDPTEPEAPEAPVVVTPPDSVTTIENNRVFPKSNFITKLASHLLPIPSQENGVTDRWDLLAYALGASAVTASNFTGFPLPTTIGKLVVNASVLVLNYGGKWALNSVGRADENEVKAGRMTSEQATQRRLERINKHGRFTRVTKNLAKGAAAAAVVFGVVNLSELALSSAQAAVGAAPDILSGATNLGESAAQFGQHAVESVTQFGQNAVEAVTQTGENISKYVTDVIHHLVPDLDLGGSGGEVLHKASEGFNGGKNELVKAFRGIIKAVAGKGFWESDLSSLGNISEWADQAGGPSHEDMVKALVRGIWNSQHPDVALQPFSDSLPLDQQVGYLDLSKLTQEQSDTLRALLKTGSREDYMNFVNNARGLFNQYVAVTK